MKNLRLRRYLSSDYFRRKETRPAEKSQLKSFTFSSNDSDLKKLVANAVPESTKKSTKCAVNVFEGEESYE